MLYFHEFTTRGRCCPTVWVVGGFETMDAKPGDWICGYNGIIIIL